MELTSQNKNRLCMITRGMMGRMRYFVYHAHPVLGLEDKLDRANRRDFG